MRKRKPGQPAGTDLDWFVIPIQKIRQWGIVLVLLIVAGAVGYILYRRRPRSPEERALLETAEGRSLPATASGAPGVARPAPNPRFPR